jgi:hypothetical protein
VITRSLREAACRRRVYGLSNGFVYNRVKSEKSRSDSAIAIAIIGHCVRTVSSLQQHQQAWKLYKLFVNRAMIAL